MKNIVGFYLIDAEHSALNNAGEKPGDRTENKVHVKQIKKRDGIYPYVSGQAVRYWWRTSLREIMDWKLSPMHREKKISYSEGDPITYPDDDIFGYMRAPKNEKETLTRASPLKVSPLMSVKSQRPNVDYGTSTRAEGDPVPYEYEFYSTIMKGAFSLDIESVGKFVNKQRSGFINLSEKKIEEVKEDEVEKFDIEISEEYGSDSNNFQCYIPDDERKRRVKDAIKVLPRLFGGAKQANLLTDVSPKFIVLALANGGNNIFLDIADSRKDKPVINTDALFETIIEYDDLLLTDVYIGRKPGFLEQLDDEISTQIEEYQNREEPKTKVRYGGVRETVNNFIEGLYE